MRVSRTLTGPSIRTVRARRRTGRLRLALAVWWRGTELDRRLAAGEDPWASDELTLRARRLTTARSRARVAKGLAGALRSAGNGTPVFTAAVRPRSEALIEVGATIASIERRLRAPGPVTAGGVAVIRLLLIDGNGPLYQPSDPGALGVRLRAAAAALRASGAD
jgi:hypothetical protein